MLSNNKKKKKKYSFLAKLGQGAHGSVLKARNLKNNRVVAVKQVQLLEDTNAQLRVFREVQTLRQCNHKNIVKLLDVFFFDELYADDDDEQKNNNKNNNYNNYNNFQQPGVVSIVLEFVESNLKLVIADTKRPFCGCLARSYFTQILYGLSYLHHLDIMHRDLKPENILITSRNGVKIADFGLACIFFPNNPQRSYEHQVATRWYRAPELLFGATKYTPKVDLWAFGCIFGEFFNCAPLFAGGTDIEQLGKVFQVLGTPTAENWPGWELLPDAGKVLFDVAEPIDDWQKFVPLANTDCVQLIHALLQFDQSKRPSALRCLESDYFAKHPSPNVSHSFPTYKPPSLEENNKKRRRRVEIAYRFVGGEEEEGEEEGTLEKWNF